MVIYLKMERGLNLNLEEQAMLADTMCGNAESWSHNIVFWPYFCSCGVMFPHIVCQLALLVEVQSHVTHLGSVLITIFNYFNSHSIIKATQARLAGLEPGWQYFVLILEFYSNGLFRFSCFWSQNSVGKLVFLYVILHKNQLNQRGPTHAMCSNGPLHQVTIYIQPFQHQHSLSPESHSS